MSSQQREQRGYGYKMNKEVETKREKKVWSGDIHFTLHLSHLSIEKMAEILRYYGKSLNNFNKKEY